MEEQSRNCRWLFLDEDLRNTPSIRIVGITLDQELTFRQKQAMLIQTIGLKSGLTQLAVNTSVIFMHRFFMYRTVKSYPRVPLALGFAFAGGKVEESARKLEHLIRTAVDVIRSNKNRDFLDKADPLTYDMDNQWRSKMEALLQSNCNTESGAYLEMRKLVLECETEIYAVIGFQLQIVHPHNFVIRMCALLGAENIKDISQYAYNLATASSQLTMLCLKYKPETIATMCLNIAAKAHSVRFESMKDPTVKWYQVLHASTDFLEIETVTEEFLHLIKGCPLLPSWMTNLARMSRVNSSRAAPGPSRGPGASTASAPQGTRQALPSSSAQPSSAAASGNIPPPSSSHPPRSQQTASSAAPHGSEPPSSASGSQSDNVISPSNRQNAQEGGSSGGNIAPDSHSRDSAMMQGHPPSHSRSHQPGNSTHMRPPHPSSSSSTAQSSAHHGHHHHNQQQQPQRPHPASGGRPSNPPASGSGSSRPPPKPQTSGSSQPSGSRTSSQHIASSGSHTSSHTASRHDASRSHHDPSRPGDQARSHQDALRHEVPRSRDSSRSHDPTRAHESTTRPHDAARPQDSSRHGHPRPDRRSESHQDSRRPHSQAVSRDELDSSRQQTSAADQFRPSQPSPHTPTTSPPAIKPPSPPEPAPELSNTLLASGDAPDVGVNTNRNSSSPEGQSKENLDQPKLKLASQGPKLSLSMYRERANARTRTTADQGTSGEESNSFVSAADDVSLDAKPGSSTSSPADGSLKASGSSAELSNFTKPQDSPNNPRIKIKVKRDPSSGEHRAVKYADSGLKIKIKPIRSENMDAEAGPSGASSRSSTPREEGEIVDDTPPSSASRSEGLRIRLPVPKSDNGGSYSKRDSDQGSNGFGSERESGHRSHHHGHHHRSHHPHKSKKHSSKHDRSRHEGKSSSKRSSSAMDYYEDRPSKSSRMDSYSSSAAGGDIAYHSGYGDHSSHTSSSRNLQHQNSGFSISDAFSSTLPQNIFDDDEDEAGHALPPITPTNEAVPPHHERFHQLMAQHRARMEAKKPPLPKGPPPPKSSPPPPPPPPTL